MFLTGSAD